MKVTTFKTLVFALFVIMAFSCKKSKDEAPPVVKTKTDLITTTSWKVQKLQADLNNDGTPETDVSGFTKACQLDNIYTFKSNGTGTTDESTTKCNSGDPQSGDFTWSFKSNETILSGNLGFFTGDGAIKTLNETNLVFSYDDNFGTAVTYKVFVTLQH